MDLEINKILEYYEKTLSEYYRKIVVLTLENEKLRLLHSEMLTEREKMNRLLESMREELNLLKGEEVKPETNNEV